MLGIVRKYTFKELEFQRNFCGKEHYARFSVDLRLIFAQFKYN